METASFFGGRSEAEAAKKDTVDSRKSLQKIIESCVV